MNERPPGPSEDTERIGADPARAEDPTRLLGDGLASAAPAPKPHEDRPVPFGKYLLISEISRGGMGIVYRARDPLADRDLALKVLTGTGESADVELARFRNEVSAASKLRHPHIVPVHDVGVDEGRFYFTMTLVEGGGLDSLLKSEGPLAPRRAATLLRQAAEAVGFAHAAGIIHRDIKPANMLLDESEHLQLTDFGLAKRIDTDERLTRTGEIVGTPHYMAPEQLLSGGEPVPQTDVFALGAVLYEALVGRPPFEDDNVFELFRKITDAEPIPIREVRSQVHRDLQTIVARCLEKSPADRYSDARELAEDLRRFSDGEPIHARPIGALQRMGRWVRRHRAISALCAAILVIVGLVGWRAAGPATLAVSSAPAGARVRIARLGIETHTPTKPLRIWPARVVTVEVSHPGHVTQRVRVDLAPGQSSERRVTLAPDLGWLDVSSDPPGAEVLVRGEATGRVTPVVGLPLAPGFYQLTLRRAGYRDASVSLTLGRGSRRTVPVTLEPSFGAVSVVTRPPGARVHVGAKAGAGLETPAVLRLPVGAHVLRLTRPFHQPVDVAIEVEGGRTRTVERDLRLEQLPLTLAVAPAGARVELAHRELGRSWTAVSPGNLLVPSGHYTATVSADGHAPRTARVTVAPGGRATLSLRLLPRFEDGWRFEAPAEVSQLLVGGFGEPGELDVVVLAANQAIRLSGRTGQTLWRHRASVDLLGGAVGDLDRDARDDVVVTQRRGVVRLLRGHDGRVLWTTRLAARIPHGATIVDLEGDGQLEVLVADETGRLVALEGRTGQTRWKLDGDGRRPQGPPVAVDTARGIVVALPRARGAQACTSGGVLLWRAGITLDALHIVPWPGAAGQLLLATTGALARVDALTGKPQAAGRKPLGTTAPVIVDLEGDGTVEVLVPTLRGLIAFDDRLQPRRAPASAGATLSVLAADLDGDPATAEIVATGSSRVRVLRAGADGPLWAGASGPGLRAAPVLADLDRNGATDICHVVGGRHVVLRANRRPETRLALDLPGKVVAPPLLCGETVILATGAKELSGLDRALGYRWRRDRPTGAVSLTALGTLAAVISRDGQILVVDGSTGETRWTAQSRRLGRAVASADVDGDGRQDLVIVADRHLVALSGRTGRPIWRWPTLPISLLASDGKQLYLVDENRRLRALRPDGRTVRWERALGVFPTRLVLADADKVPGPEVIVAGVDGRLIVMAATDGAVHQRTPSLRGPLLAPLITIAPGRARRLTALALSSGVTRAASFGASGQPAWSRTFAWQPLCGPLAVHLIDPATPQAAVGTTDARVLLLSPATGSELATLRPGFTPRHALRLPPVGGERWDSLLLIAASGRVLLVRGARRTSPVVWSECGALGAAKATGERQGHLREIHDARRAGLLGEAVRLSAKLAPHDPAAYLRGLAAAELCLRRDRPEAAVRHLVDATRLPVDDPAPYRLLIQHGSTAPAAVAALGASWLRDPLTFTRQVLPARPGPVVTAVLAAATKSLGHAPEASKDLVIAAAALLALGRHDDALERLRQRLEVRPDDTEARLSTATCHLRAGRPAAALGHLDALRARESWPAEVETLRAAALSALEQR